MKTQKKIFFKQIAALLFVLALVLPTDMNAKNNGRSSSGWAQFWASIFGGNGGKHHQGPKGHKAASNSGPSDSVPLDGGLSFLVLGAAAFGVRKLRGNKNDKQ